MTSSIKLVSQRTTRICSMLLMMMMFMVINNSQFCNAFQAVSSCSRRIKTRTASSTAIWNSRVTTGTTTGTPAEGVRNNKSNKKILILGGTGYLGQYICKTAIEQGYSVVSVSRRGLPKLDTNIMNDEEKKQILSPTSGYIDYRQGDARQKATITNILEEDQKGEYTAVIHCIGLLFDTASGLGSFNEYVSGSMSIPDSESTYDTITRVTSFNAIDGTIEYAKKHKKQNFPFIFISAAEAGWPQMTGGPFIESIMPDFIGRYMIAKRAVEDKLINNNNSQPTLRPIIFRPSLIYSKQQLASLPSVAVFTFANAIGVPFVDRPVTVTALSTAVVNSIHDNSVVGVQRYMKIDKLGAST